MWTTFYKATYSQHCTRACVGLSNYENQNTSSANKKPDST